MSSDTVHTVISADGPAALPRSNGELVFQAPWESRAFGVAVALHDAGAIDYEGFRSRLIAEIAAHADGAAEDGGDYYERWLDALQQVLEEKGIVSAEEIGRRAAEIAHAWDNDHDHGHEHEHEHEHGHGRIDRSGR
jgi:nitrile hydratase accessory protein